MEVQCRKPVIACHGLGTRELEQLARPRRSEHLVCALVPVPDPVVRSATASAKRSWDALSESRTAASRASCRTSMAIRMTASAASASVRAAVPHAISAPGCQCNVRVARDEHFEWKLGDRLQRDEPIDAVDGTHRLNRSKLAFAAHRKPSRERRRPSHADSAGDGAR